MQPEMLGAPVLPVGSLHAVLPIHDLPHHHAPRAPAHAVSTLAHKHTRRGRRANNRAAALHAAAAAAIVRLWCCHLYVTQLHLHRELARRGEGA